jgi:hypothetical protein
MKMDEEQEMAVKIPNKNEVVQYDPQNNFLAMIERLASNPDVDVEKLHRIMDAQERVLDRNAAQAFNHDMALAQAKIKVAIKDKFNQQTRSNYASEEAIDKAINTASTDMGFSLSFYEEDSPKPNHIRVCVDIMHRDGCTKVRHTDVPIDDKGIAGKTNKTQTHAFGSSLSYGTNYLKRLVFNVPRGDGDDGNGASGIEYIQGEDLERIKKLVKEVVTDMNAFLKVAHATSIDTIPVSEHIRVLGVLNERRVVLAKSRVPGQEG